MVNGFLSLNVLAKMTESLISIRLKERQRERERERESTRERERERCIYALKHV